MPRGYFTELYDQHRYHFFFCKGSGASWASVDYIAQYFSCAPWIQGLYICLYTTARIWHPLRIPLETSFLLVTEGSVPMDTIVMDERHFDLAMKTFDNPDGKVDHAWGRLCVRIALMTI